MNSHFTVSRELIPGAIREDLQFISNQVRSVGKEAFLIGGAVRDMMLGKSPKEYDIATSLLPEEVKNLFRKVIETGIQHGTVLVLLKNGSYEFTTYRTEKGYSDSRRPDTVEFSSSLREDVQRRDFTMNALALDLETFSILDFHDGILDIQNKIIRTIGNPIERFTEDGLRPVRAIRFLSALEFQMEEKTYQAIFLTRHITAKISRERFHDEILKILTTTKPSTALVELAKNKIFSLFVETVNEEFQNMYKIDDLSSSPVSLRLSYLIWNLINQKENLELADIILKNLKFSKENTRDTLFYLSFWSNPPEKENISSYYLRKLLSKIYKSYTKAKREEILSGLYSFLEIYWNSDTLKFYEEGFSQIQKNDDPLLLSDLVIDGNWISQNFPQIPKLKFGNLLYQILENVLENPDLNNPDTIYNWIENKYLPKI